MSNSPDQSAGQARSARRPRLRFRTWVLIFVGLGLFFSFLPRAPHHAVIRRLIIGALAKQSGREIRVGDVRGILWYGVAVDGLSLSEEGGFGPGGDRVQFSVGTVEIRYSLWRMLFGGGPVGGIGSIVVHDPQGRVTRLADGRIDLVELFRPPEKPEEPSRFAARLTVVGGTLHLFDETTAHPAAPDRPWHHRLAPRRVELKFNGDGPIELRSADLALVPTETPALFLNLTAHGVTIAPEPLAIDGEMVLTSLDLAALQAYLAPAAGEQVVLLGGRADVSGRVTLAMPAAEADQPAVGLRLALRAEAASLRLAQLGRPIDSLSGTINLDLQTAHDGSRTGGVVLEGVRVTVAGSELTLDGTVNDLADPDLSLRVDAPRLRLGALPALLPDQPALAALSGDGLSRANVQINGRLAALRLDGWIDAADVAWAGQGRLLGGRTHFQLQRLPAESSPFGVEGRLRFEQVAAEPELLGRPVERLNGEVQLAGRELTLRDLSAEVGGAPFRAAGRIAGLGETLRLALEVSFENLSPMAVAPAVPAAFRPTASRGVAAGDLSLTGPVDALAIAGRLSLPEISLPQGRHLGGRYELDLRLAARPTGRVRISDAGFDLARLCAPVTRLNGAVTLRGDGVVLDDLRFNYGGDAVRADGSLALDASRFDLAVHTAGVDMERVACVIGRRDVSGAGRLRLDLRVRGTPRRLHLAGSAVVPRVRVPGVQVRAADLRLDLSVEPARGAAGLDGLIEVRSAALRADAAPAELSELRGRLRFAGARLVVSRLTGRADGDSFAVDGVVRGLPRVAAVDLNVSTSGLRQATIERLAPELTLFENLSLTEPVRADLVLRGPLEALLVRGPVAVPALALGADRSTVVGGRAELDLIVGGEGELPADGTATLAAGHARVARLGLPAHDLRGQLRLHRDGRVVIVEGSELDAISGRLGDAGTPFRVRGEVTVGEPTLLDLALDLDRLSVAELEQAASALDEPPEITGEGELRIVGLRILGSTERLRITTGEGVTAGWIDLPARLVARGYELAGGRARADLTIASNRLEQARIDLLDAAVGIESTGTRIAALTGSVTLAENRLTAEADGRVGGRLVRVEPRDSPAPPDPDGPLRVDLQVRSREVPLFELLPSLAGLAETIAADRVSSDLSVYGPLDDLSVGGQVLLAGGPSGVQPLRMDLVLRLVSAGEAEPELFGGVRFAGGGLPLRLLDRPLSGFRGGLSLSTREVVFEDLTADLAGGQVVLRGAVHGFPEPRFDLAVDLVEVDLGATLAELRLPPPDDPDGPRLDPFTARDLPQLRTPEPVSGRVTLHGPREAVAVAMSLDLPLITVEPTRAMVEDRGLGAGDPLFEQRGAMLLADAELGGSAIGSLAGSVPDTAEVVAAVERLAGFSLIGFDPPRALPPPEPEPEPEQRPSLLESFSLALHLASDAVNVRQVVAFLSEKARTETLSTLYAHLPGRVEVDILGPATAPELVGSIELPRVEYYGVPFRRVALEFDLFDQVFTYTNGIADVRGGQIRSSGAVAITPGEPIDFVAGVEVEAIELAVLNQMGLAGLEQREVDGTLDGELTVHLSEEVPRVQGALELGALSVDGLPLGDGRVRFAFEDKRLVLHQARLEDAETGARAELRGSAGLEDDGLLDLAADIQNLDLGAVAGFIPDLGPERLSGRLDFAGHLGGSRRLPLLGGTGSVRFGSLYGYPFARLSLNSVETGPNAMRTTVELVDPAYQVRAVANLDQIDFATGSAQLSAAVEELEVDLALALPLVGEQPALADSAGRLTGSAEITGRLPGRVEVAEGETPPSIWSTMRGDFALSAGEPGRARSLRIAGQRLDRIDLAGRVADNAMTIRRLELLAGETRIGIDPARPSRIDDLGDRRVAELHLTSDQLYYDDLVALTGLPLQTEGYITLNADLYGELADPRADVRVGTHGLVINGEAVPDRLITAIAGRSFFGFADSQRFELFGCRAVIDGGNFGDSMRLNAELEVLDWARLRAFLVAISRAPEDRAAAGWQVRLGNLAKRLPEPLRGELRTTLSLSGTPDRPLGDWSLDAVGLAAGPDARPLPDLVVRTVIGRPTTPELDPPPAETIQLFGNVDLRRDEVTGRRDGLVRMQAVSGRIDLGRYAPWTVAEGLDGDGSLQAVITGTLAAPRVELVDLSLRDLRLDGWSAEHLTIAELIYTPDELDLGTITLAGSGLSAELSARLPLGGTPAAGATGAAALVGQLQPDTPLSATFHLESRDAGALAAVLPSLALAEGSAAVDLTLGGTARHPDLDGRIVGDLPRLVVAKAVPETEPETEPEPEAEPEAEAEPVPAEPEPLPEGVEAALDLRETQVDIRVADNRFTVERFATRLSGGDGRPGGELRIAPGGSVDLQHLAADRLLENPVRLELEGRDLSLLQRDLRIVGLNLDVALQPRDDLATEQQAAGWLTRVMVERVEGWVNGGLVVIEGDVGIRSPDPAQWQANDYALRLGTPVIAAGSATPPAFPERFRPRAKERQGGVYYPVRLERGAVGEVNLGLDLALETRAGQTPPLTLSGQVELFGATLREGIIALFARRPERGAAPPAWPAAPQLDVLITAEEDNWIHMRVPTVDVPIGARVRLTETPQQLRLDGTANLGEGGLSASLLKSQIRLRGGDARFSVRRNAETAVFEPFASFRASATTVVRDTGDRRESYDVTLDARGTVRPGVQRPIDTDVQLVAKSSPPLPEQRIFALLSRREEFVQAVEEGNLQSFVRDELANVALQAALGVALSPLLEEFREALGLDVLRFEYNLDGSFDIEAGQYLDPGDRLFVTVLVEVGGRLQKQTFRLDYRLAHGVSVGAQIDTFGDFRLGTEYSAQF